MLFRSGVGVILGDGALTVPGRKGPIKLEGTVLVEVILPLDGFTTGVGVILGAGALTVPGRKGPIKLEGTVLVGVGVGAGLGLGLGLGLNHDLGLYHAIIYYPPKSFLQFSKNEFDYILMELDLDIYL